MKIFSLIDILRDKNYSKAGNDIFKGSINPIIDGDVIIINMEGVDSVPTTFMNTSFGALMDIFGEEKVKKSFRFRNVLKSQIERFRQYFDDYKIILEKKDYKVEIIKTHEDKFKYIIKTREGKVNYESIPYNNFEECYHALNNVISKKDELKSE